MRQLDRQGDSLYYERMLMRCLVVIELKLGKFTHADAGQMHLYLIYGSENWVLPDELWVAELKAALDAGRLLVVSPFPEGALAATAQLAARRNRFVAALADQIFVAHAAVGSKTEEMCRQLLKGKKRLITFDRDENRNLLDLGAVATTVEQAIGVVVPPLTQPMPSDGIGDQE